MPRSWSIPSEDPYEEAARQLLEQALRPSEYVPDPMELRISTSFRDIREGDDDRFRDGQHEAVTQVEVCSRESSEIYTRQHYALKDRCTVRAEIEAIRARVYSIRTECRRHEWHASGSQMSLLFSISYVPSLKAVARLTLLEDTGSSSYETSLCSGAARGCW
ncbi:hypothetical protein Tco_0930983 [Tanacetum coccineum]